MISEFPLDVTFIIDSKVYEVVKVPWSNSLLIPEDPCKEGCVFDGWYWEPDCINRVLHFSPAWLPFTLYGRWEEEVCENAIEPITTYLRINEKGIADPKGSYILFGEYPQTIKDDNVVIRRIKDSRGYYLGSDGNYYAKIKATLYENPEGTLGALPAYSTGKLMKEGETLYFKVEPIKWFITQEENGAALLTCEKIIASQKYHRNKFRRDINGKTIFANDYDYSGIRTWLNEEFYNTSFTESQKSLIKETLLDHSEDALSNIANAPVCQAPKSKVFLLSLEEIIHIDINNFIEYESESESYFQNAKQVSDYARAQGAAMVVRYSEYGAGWWWLRSPCNLQSEVLVANPPKNITKCNSVTSRGNGVIPSLIIDFSKGQD